MEQQKPDASGSISNETTSNEAAENSQESSLSGNLGGLVILAVVGIALWFFGPDSLKYSVLYQINLSRVQVADKPKDCDWDHAPLGDKACHYQKQVTPLRNENGTVTDVIISWEKVQD